ncbi:hypothetical protein ACWGH9_24700, partial [Streptomyces chryseus]
GGGGGGGARARGGVGGAGGGRGGGPARAPAARPPPPLPEVIGDAGLAAADSGAAFAGAVRQLLARPEEARRAAARARAELFGWPAAVDAFLAAHDARTPVRSPEVKG